MASYFPHLEEKKMSWFKGYKINWELIYQGANFVRIPTYAWQNERLWYESTFSERMRLGKMDHQFLGLRQQTPEPLWKSDFSLSQFAFLKDHKIMGNVVFPAADAVHACAPDYSSQISSLLLVRLTAQSVQEHRPRFNRVIEYPPPIASFTEV